MEPIRIFKDDELEQQLCEEGYVIMPFFDAEEVQRFLSFFHEEHKEESQRIYAISHSADVDFKTRVSAWVRENYRAKVEEHFHEVQIMGGTFVAKPAGGKGLITPHRDWNLVDESCFRSCNIWVPLVDTFAENGAIQILPKSHLLGPTYRGPNIENQLKYVEEYLWHNLQLKPMKAGHAFVYDHRFIHGSRHNNTEEIRPASACAIAPKAAEYRFYHQYENEHGTFVDEFESYPDYLLREDRFDYPTTIKKLQTLEYETGFFDESHFAGLEMKPLPVETATPEGGFWQKIKSRFS